MLTYEALQPIKQNQNGIKDVIKSSLNVTLVMVFFYQSHL